MSRPDPTQWMWAQAVDFIDRAERMHRQFYRLVSSSSHAEAVWQPPADVFEDGEQVVVVIALPGVVAERVEIAAEPGALVVRAHRPLPFAGTALAVRQLEIPYGVFERRIPLEQAPLQVIGHELGHGCLVVRLAKVR